MKAHHFGHLWILPNWLGAGLSASLRSPMLRERVVKLFMTTLWPALTARCVDRINLALAINMTQSHHMGVHLDLLAYLGNLWKSGDADHPGARVLPQESL